MNEVGLNFSAKTIKTTYASIKRETRKCTGRDAPSRHLHHCLLPCYLFARLVIMVAFSATSILRASFSIRRLSMMVCSIAIFFSRLLSFKNIPDSLRDFTMDGVRLPGKESDLLSPQSASLVSWDDLVSDVAGGDLVEKFKGGTGSGMDDRNAEALQVDTGLVA